jgi:hypothetical protein
MQLRECELWREAERSLQANVWHNSSGHLACAARWRRQMTTPCRRSVPSLGSLGLELLGHDAIGVAILVAVGPVACACRRAAGFALGIQADDPLFLTLCLRVQDSLGVNSLASCRRYRSSGDSRAVIQLRGSIVATSVKRCFPSRLDRPAQFGAAVPDLPTTIMHHILASAHREGVQVADGEVVVVGCTWHCALGRHHGCGAVEAHNPFARLENADG